MGLQKETVIATFSNVEDARAAERALDAAGISSYINLIENDQDDSYSTPALSSEKTTHRVEHGGGIGGFFARLFGFDSDWDDNNESHSYFRERYNARHHLIIVRDCADVSLARQILQDNGGVIEERGRSLYEQELSRSGTDERVMELREEQLLARKERVQSGEVNIRKEIVQETKTIEVPVTREELVIERHPLHGEARPGTIDVAAIGENEEIRIPVTEERVRVEKQVVPREEIVVAKKKVEDVEVVADTIKREEARVETKGRVEGKTESLRKDKFRRDDDYQPGL